MLHIPCFFCSPFLLLISLLETYGETCVSAGTVSCATAKVKGSSETWGIDLGPVKVINRPEGSLKILNKNMNSMRPNDGLLGPGNSSNPTGKYTTC